MKVGRLKAVIKDQKLVFEKVADTQIMRFDQIEDINNKLKRLNIERYMIRRSKQPKKLLPEPQQIVVGTKRA